MDHNGGVVYLILRLVSFQTVKGRYKFGVCVNKTL